MYFMLNKFSVIALGTIEQTWLLEAASAIILVAQLNISAHGSYNNFKCIIF